ncbi:MAG: hypothetical protein GWN00_09825, partial [Aliifodinibius sp.]|nr:hypothetical protein [Phycisphaerae bacterium]NIR64672.1 hypothetical protein [candidate division Zixibacteria bacterium]NIT56507.1 hypothetical protein [Fodinibius sp.]NIX02521.1 hypothetical protein [Phycisphaerae bacterium]NIY25090.1 hypothetical protein [Fodinibius sp.]
VVTKDGVFVTDGTDGKLQYTTIADDLDEIGIWHLQGYLVMNEGSWHSNKVIFRVSDVVS